MCVSYWIHASAKKYSFVGLVDISPPNSACQGDLCALLINLVFLLLKIQFLFLSILFRVLIYFQDPLTDDIKMVKSAGLNVIYISSSATNKTVLLAQPSIVFIFYHLNVVLRSLLCVYGAGWR